MFPFLQVIEKLQQELECVNLTINQLKEDAEATKECFEAEKAHWIDEKEKVIRYQKQLQLNYVQVRNIPIPYYSIKTSYLKANLVTQMKMMT